MSLLALTLAVGNLVDDAIVEIENVERHIRMGKPPVPGGLDSTAEVGLAVLTTTATIVAVFIPVAFMGGIPGQFFQPFGVTVATATIFSTLVARLMTPMMAAYLLKSKPALAPALNGYEIQGYLNGGQHWGQCQWPGSQGWRPMATARDQSQRRSQPYLTLLKAALRHRLVTIALAVIFRRQLDAGALHPHQSV
jgi:multidrug efflux pump subunit AcrB